IPRYERPYPTDPDIQQDASNAYGRGCAGSASSTSTAFSTTVSANMTSSTLSHTQPGSSSGPSASIVTSASRDNFAPTTKKGAGFWESININWAISDTGASWAYNWNPDPSAALSSPTPAGVELVPMIWGLGQNTTSNLALIKSKYKTLLGFNEPDSSLKLSDAIAAWPSIVGTGLRIGSPAPAHTSLKKGDWFFDFMANVTESGLRPDFICLHHYSSTFNVTAGVENFQAYLHGVYEYYQLPIWVTEFAMVSYQADGSWITPPDLKTQADYATAASTMLQGLPFVERFAWFAVPQNKNQPPTNLYDNNGNITLVGKAYKAV
ncbi:MAG: hypothetical protein M1830_005143, partial [Pleopsidium flavum]